MQAEPESLPEPVALVSVEDLVARLPFELDANETREAEGALDDLSDDARLHGKTGWSSPAVTPQPVKNLILKAAARHMKNHDGYTTSRAGDETVTWPDRGHQAGTAYFTEIEIKALKAMAARPGIYSVPILAWAPQRQRPEGLVPDEASNEPIQMFATDEDPW